LRSLRCDRRRSALLGQAGIRQSAFYPASTAWVCRAPPPTLNPFTDLHPQFGCLVVNAPTANTVAAAEHGIALMCSLARNVSQADASMRAGKWERSKYVGVSLVDKTLAVMGFGKVRGGIGLLALGQRGRLSWLYRHLAACTVAHIKHLPPTVTNQ
jgi:hypothetical protein